jgi:hypothetical protein
MGLVAQGNGPAPLAGNSRLPAAGQLSHIGRMCDVHTTQFRVVPAVGQYLEHHMGGRVYGRSHCLHVVHREEVERIKDSGWEVGAPGRLGRRDC